MATKFGLKQAGNVSPAWVIKAIAAITGILQAIPLAVTASPAVNQPTKDLVHLICSLLNIVLVGLAPLFGQTENKGE